MPEHQQSKDALHEISKLAKVPAAQAYSSAMAAAEEIKSEKDRVAAVIAATKTYESAVKAK